MLRHVGRIVALSVLLTHAGAALALVDAQVLVGRRWYDFKADGKDKKGVTSQEVGVAVHLDPIPLIPVAFGASIVSGSPSKNDLGVDQAAIFQASGEVMAWVPMVPFVTPYVRLRYPVQGTLVTKSTLTEPITGLKTETAATYNLSGPQLSIGAKIPTLPLIKILIEAGQGAETYKSSEIKVDGQKISADDDGDLPSRTVVIGLEVGF